MKTETSVISEERNSNHRNAPIGTTRRIVILILSGLLIYLCMQTDHAGAKGRPVSPQRLVPVLVAAALSVFAGKRYINSIAGVFLGGIGGALAMQDALDGPYGGIVGLVLGGIVVALPMGHKRASSKVSSSAAKTDTVAEK